MVNAPEPSDTCSGDPSDARSGAVAAGFLPDPAEPLSAGFRAAVQTVLTTFLDGQRPLLEGIGPELDPVLAMARSLTAGGKRLRPAFCLWGHAAVGGDPGDPDVLAAAASLDLLHVSALVHDDLIDGSDTRRGQPAAHRRFEALHAGSGWRGTGTALGQAGAVLLGDLLVMWSVELLERAVLRLGRPHEALQLAQLMRTEVTCGQYLDVVAQVSPLREGGDRAAVDRAHRVVEHKSARYTVTRPLQLGAALSGPLPAATREALQQYGSHVGRAFQFRDDVLGVFGDEAVTGKPAGDDLREGKQTLLLAEARAGLAGAGLARLDALVGRPDLDADGVAEARDLIEASGALTRLETLIEDHGRQGLAALSGGALAEDGRVALEQLAHAALRRSS